MKQPRMNVQTIAEVLIDELDKLEKTSKRIESVLPAVDERLKALQRTAVSLDTKDAERILSRFETLSQNKAYFPYLGDDIFHCSPSDGFLRVVLGVERV